MSITIELSGGDILNKPRVLWIKGKWNEITKGDRYDMTKNESAKVLTHTLTFKSPKMTDCGLYTVRIGVVKISRENLKVPILKLS